MSFDSLVALLVWSFFFNGGGKNLIILAPGVGDDPDLLAPPRPV
jgi:hypothetical protein